MSRVCPVVLLTLCLYTGRSTVPSNWLTAGTAASSERKCTSVRPLFSSYIRASYLQHDLSYADVLDGAMITLATFTLNFLHPGWLLGEGPWPNEEYWETQRAHSPSIDTYAESGANTPKAEV